MKMFQCKDKTAHKKLSPFAIAQTNLPKNVEEVRTFDAICEKVEEIFIFKCPIDFDNKRTRNFIQYFPLLAH